MDANACVAEPAYATITDSRYPNATINGVPVYPCPPNEDVLLRLSFSDAFTVDAALYFPIFPITDIVG